MSSQPKFAQDDGNSIPIRIVDKSYFSKTNQIDEELVINWAKSNGFHGDSGEILTVPDNSGNVSMVLVGDMRIGARSAPKFYFAEVLRKLPAGNYHLEGEFSQLELEEAALASLFEQYHYDRYLTGNHCKARLVLPTGCDGEYLMAIAAGEFITRDLINTPTSNLGPTELESIVAKMASKYNAAFHVIEGNRLKSDFPLIFAVGKAAAPPRLLDFRWGDIGPKLTIVGKGVCFDTGGLNIKPGGSMKLMKKDMGGAAVSIGLAEMIMRTNLPLQLRVLIPAVENSISGNSMRPGDVLTSRAGITVEVTNTDAEGRLVLADAIDLANEEEPDLMITLATLTGAARVALGPEIVPFYTDNDKLADILETSSRRVRDQIWRMPLWDGYKSMLMSDIANFVNSPSSGFAGSITAALFLKEFIASSDKWLHFDLYCWQNKREPGLPKGGIGQTSRAIFDALPEILSL